MTDPISDMLTRVRNAVTAKHARVDVPASKLKAEIARILANEGYISGFKMVDEPKATTQRQVIRLFLTPPTPCPEHNERRHIADCHVLSEPPA